MTNKDILRMRLAAQRLTGEKPTTPVALLAAFGAMQAQDYGMSKWAIGQRLKKSTRDEVEQALDRGEIIRTHVMRPTWHLVRSADVRWMLDLTAPRIKAAMAFRNRQLQLDEKIFRRAGKIIEKALARDRYLTRATLMPLLNKAGIATDDNRSSHILLRCELDGLICSGPRQGKQFTYALLEERVPPTEKLSRDEALAELARRYFGSHGPATLHDFSWWSGLSVADSKKGLELLGTGLQQATLAEKKFWYLSEQVSAPKIPPALLLPAYDEWTIGYADRTELFLSGYERKVVTTNGIFRPVLLCNGMVAGSWKATEKKGGLSIDKEWFHTVSASAQKALKVAEEKYKTWRY